MTKNGKGDTVTLPFIIALCLPRGWRLGLCFISKGREGLGLIRSISSGLFVAYLAWLIYGVE